MTEWDPDLAPHTDVATPGRAPVLPSRMHLLVLTGPDQGKQLELERGSYLVGKAPGCALVLTDGEISRQHLELQVEESGVRVKDLGSTNGSFYEGARFSEVTVGAGAVITIGATALKLTAAERPHALLPSAADRFGGLIGASLAMREV